MLAVVAEECTTQAWAVLADQAAAVLAVILQQTVLLELQI
jgi:hypothetical protein